MLNQPATELTALRDLHLPAALGFWPIAPVYVCGLVIFALALAVVFWRVRRKRRPITALDLALTDLRVYQSEYQRNRDLHLGCIRLSALLRRVALLYFPAEQVAGLQGIAWLNFLNQHAAGLDFTPYQRMLLQYPYQSKVPDGDLEALFELVAAWLEARRTDA